MAVERALTIQTITKKNFKKKCSTGSSDIHCALTPNTKPMIAKGNAKMVCENFTKLK
jgi:hypothetical protein